MVHASSLHIPTAEMCSQDGCTTISSSRFPWSISCAKLWCGLPACTAPTLRCAAKMAAPQFGSANPIGVGFPNCARPSAAAGVWHFSGAVSSGLIHGESSINDILESRCEGQSAFLRFWLGVGR